jgi:hypothetical protein
VVDILEKLVHPKYDGVSAYYDVAILTTKEMTFTRAISPICLPEDVSYDVNKYDNDLAELIGWGSSVADGSVSNLLKRANVKVFSQRYEQVNLFVSFK